MLESERAKGERGSRREREGVRSQGAEHVQQLSYLLVSLLKY